MPRPTPARDEPVTYTPGLPPAPGTPPEQITRAVWDELHRLASYLESLRVAPVTREGRKP